MASRLVGQRFHAFGFHASEISFTIFRKDIRDAFSFFFFNPFIGVLHRHMQFIGKLYADGGLAAAHKPD